MVITCLFCCKKLDLKSAALPLFFVFNLAFSLLIGIGICKFESQVILMAAIATFVLAFELTVYACKCYNINLGVTKTDLTGYGPYLAVIMSLLFMFGIACIKFPVVNMIYSGIIALMFSIYFIYHTQNVIN